MHAGNRIDHGHHLVALGLELGAASARDVLRPAQRGDCGGGHDFRQIRDVVRIQRDHGLRDGFRSGDETDAPARHAIGLRQRIDMDHAIAQLRPRLHEVVVADAVEHHAVVDVVADDPRVRMLHQHVRERRDLGLRVDHAGRIARIVEQENLRAGQRRIELRRRQLVVLARRTRQQARLRVEDVGDVDVGRPVRHREQRSCRPRSSSASARLYSTCLAPMPVAMFARL